VVALQDPRLELREGREDLGRRGHGPPQGRDGDGEVRGMEERDLLLPCEPNRRSHVPAGRAGDDWDPTRKTRQYVLLGRRRHREFEGDVTGWKVRRETLLRRLTVRRSGMDRRSGIRCGVALAQFTF
jgi:hypothetical protein